MRFKKPFNIYVYSSLLYFGLSGFLAPSLSAQGWVFTDYQYFLDLEELGGRLHGSSAIFGSNDSFDGPVHLNFQFRLSQFGCPQFGDYAETSDSVDLANCDASVFQKGFQENVEPIYLPSQGAIDRLIEVADYTFIADQKINRPDSTLRDTLIMTEIIFEPGQVFVKQWDYLIPPLTQDTVPTQTFLDTFYQYHAHAYTGFDTCAEDGFHHFDWHPPTNPELLLLNEQLITDSGIIYVRGGQVRLSGVVQGKFTIITDERTSYRKPYDNTTQDHIYNNIWLMDDLLYADSSPSSGLIAPGSDNCLGLISGANIIVANTRANGARNSENGTNIMINGCLICMNGSFMSQYWQNSLQDYWYPYYWDPAGSRGDGRGVSQFRPHTGTSDIRGTVMLSGSLAQKKRGYVKRNGPGPYATSPGVGYERDYHYDTNLQRRIPPGFELLRDPEYTDERLSYFPLHIGDEWEYLVTSGDTSGNMNTYSEFLTVLDETQQDNGKSYWEILNTRTETSEYFRIDTTFLRVYEYDLIAGGEYLRYNLNRTRYPYQCLETALDTFRLLDNDSVGIGQTGKTGSALDYYGETADELWVRLSSYVGRSFQRKNQGSNESRLLLYARVDDSEFGEFVDTEPSIHANRPGTFVLLNNFPNPFNPSTSIRIGLPITADVTLDIYDIAGRLVYTHSEMSQPAGWMNTVWDGRDRHGKQVGTGVYFCRVSAADFSHTLKMVYLK